MGCCLCKRFRTSKQSTKPLLIAGQPNPDNQSVQVITPPPAAIATDLNSPEMKYYSPATTQTVKFTVSDFAEYTIETAIDDVTVTVSSWKQELAKHWIINEQRFVLKTYTDGTIFEEYRRLVSKNTGAVPVLRLRVEPRYDPLRIEPYEEAKDESAQKKLAAFISTQIFALEESKGEKMRQVLLSYFQSKIFRNDELKTEDCTRLMVAMENKMEPFMSGLDQRAFLKYIDENLKREVGRVCVAYVGFGKVVWVACGMAMELLRLEALTRLCTCYGSAAAVVCLFLKKTNMDLRESLSNDEMWERLQSVMDDLTKGDNEKVIQFVKENVGESITFGDLTLPRKIIVSVMVGGRLYFFSSKTSPTALIWRPLAATMLQCENLVQEYTAPGQDSALTNEESEFNPSLCIYSGFKQATDVPTWLYGETLKPFEQCPRLSLSLQLPQCQDKMDPEPMDYSNAGRRAIELNATSIKRALFLEKLIDKHTSLNDW